MRAVSFCSRGTDAANTNAQRSCVRTSSETDADSSWGNDKATILPHASRPDAEERAQVAFQDASRGPSGECARERANTTKTDSKQQKHASRTLKVSRPPPLPPKTYACRVHGTTTQRRRRNHAAARRSVRNSATCADAGAVPVVDVFGWENTTWSPLSLALSNYNPPSIYKMKARARRLLLHPRCALSRSVAPC